MFLDKKDIFFDLDHTIWDFDRNAEETLEELYSKYEFDKLFEDHSAKRFIAIYTRINHQLWSLYHHNKIDKPTLRKLRFENTFEELGVDPNLFPWNFEEEYLAICPTKPYLFPNAHETLAYLQQKYNLHLISNGFREASEQKISNSKLASYFETITISEIVGINKPDPRIFEYALDKGKAIKTSSIMIGDNIDADVRGAINFGIDAIFFNPTNKEKPSDISYSIEDLAQLKKWF